MKTIKFLLLIGISFIFVSSSLAVIHDIDIRSYSGFDPDSLDIRPGDTVRWTNIDITEQHSSVSDSLSSKSWDSGPINPGNTYDLVFTYYDGSGPFPYHCDLDTGETGSIYTKVTCYSIGDVNNDGTGLSVGDLSYLASYLSGYVDSLESPYQADLNSDCVIDSNDVNLYTSYFIYGVSVFPTYPIPTCCYVTPCCAGIRGDADNSGSVNISDAVFIINHVFSGGPEPVCFHEGDANGDGMLNISDAVHIINYVFNSGPAPAACP